jgi:hypothetical protein
MKHAAAKNKKTFRMAEVEKLMNDNLDRVTQNVCASCTKQQKIYNTII